MAKGRPAGLRLETAARTQIEFQQSSLDDLLAPDHRARQVWDYVEELDLSVLYGRVQTTVSSSGRPAIDPAILVSLWLYATLEGVGSARLLDRLCKTDLACLWLLGGVSVNYHTLSDFRGSAGPVLDELLSQSLTGLIASGSVDVRVLAVDGMKLQSLASGRSFRSAGRLAELHRASVETVRKLRAEVDEDPAASERRIKARRLAAAEDRARRLEKARRAQAKIEKRRDEAAAEQRRKEPRKDGGESRASTSDPDARVMKMGDGSFRAAYNVQIKTAVDGAHIVGVSVTDRGSDYGLLGEAVGGGRAPLWCDPGQAAGGRGLLQQGRHRDAARAGHRAVLPAATEGQNRSRPAQAWRRAGDHRLAAAHGRRTGPSPLSQALRHRAAARPHEEPRPAAPARAWHRQGEGRRALARPRLQLPTDQAARPHLTSLTPKARGRPPRRSTLSPQLPSTAPQ